MHTLTLHIDAAGANFNYLHILPTGTLPCSIPMPAAPGRLEMEAFNCGGEGVGFIDFQPFGPGSLGVRDDVGSEGPDFAPSGDLENSPSLGWVEAGEWLAYTVDVATTDTYDILLRTASINDQGRVRLFVDGVDVSGLVTTPNTGGWQTWVDVTAVTDLTLTQGVHRIQFYIEKGGANYNYMEIRPTP